jgi:Ca2+-binding EF-hand superfamily protein
MYTAALQVSGGRESQVILQADSKIRVRGRIALAEGVLAHIEGFVGVTVRHPNGSFGGNFMTSIDPQLITPEQIFGFLDKNGDKKISKAEGLDELKPNFQLIDTNGDGVIDLKEAQVMTKYVNKVHVTAEQVVGFMDKNGDGTISKAEASDELKPHFQGIDTNGDGVIDVKEAQVVAENFNIMVKGSTEHSLKIDREGRFELVFRARNLQLNPMLAHLKADLGETPVGMIVESFWGSTPVASAGLEIVELEIFQPRNK